MDNYQPVSCDQHSEYELLAMHRTPVEVKLHGSGQRHSGRVVDLLTREGSEYLVLQDDEEQQEEIRLDQIATVESRG